MVQIIIIGILLIAALAYLGRIVFRSFQGKAHCETGCAKCGDIQALPLSDRQAGPAPIQGGEG